MIDKQEIRAFFEQWCEDNDRRRMMRYTDDSENARITPSTKKIIVKKNMTLERIKSKRLSKIRRGII
jgi:hypothetical protein